MSWTYIKRDAEGEVLPGEWDKLPGPNTAYLAFESLRWGVVIGFTEKGGCSSFLGPNVNDDCNIIAFAPLSEKTEPDIERIKQSCPAEWHGGTYKNEELINLLR